MNAPRDVSHDETVVAAHPTGFWGCDYKARRAGHVSRNGAPAHYRFTGDGA